jgi:hypothetical protein
MKSIEDTLKTAKELITASGEQVEIALAGGMAVLSHGVERTTRDVDFYLYAKAIQESGSAAFFERLRAALPERFAARLEKGSAADAGAFANDVIFIEDRLGEYLRLDLIIARYKWELEAIRSARPVPGLLLPVITKPYLAAMKLRAGSYQDAADVQELVRLMSEDEKEELKRLARRLGRERNLERLLAGPEPDEVHEPANERLY